MKFSIIIPCYNEGENLKDLVSVLEKFSVKYQVEFILVENGSTDNSREQFKSLPQFDGERIKSVYIDKNRGYGYGIIQGLKVSTGDYVGWIHADLQVNPQKLVRFFEYIIKNGKDRKLFMKGRRFNRRRIERFFTAGMGIFNSLLFGTWMYEIMSMPVILHRSLLTDLRIWPKDFSIDIFIYYLAKKEGHTVVHLPVKMRERKQGNSSWNTGLASRIRQSIKMAKASIEIKDKFRKGAYQ